MSNTAKITESTKQTAEITTHPSTPAFKREFPPKVPGGDIYVEIAESLGEFELNVRFGGFNGRPALLRQAFKELNELNRAASDTFCELHETCEEVWAQHTFLQACWDKMRKRDAKK
jgi:hypothetical protein